jgi:hypothetical protein
MSIDCKELSTHLFTLHFGADWWCSGRFNPENEPKSSYADEISLVRFDFLTSVNINNNIFLDNVLCNLLDVYRCFGEMYCLHFHGRGVSYTRKYRAGSVCYLHDLPFDCEDGGISSTEKFENFYQITRHEIKEYYDVFGWYTPLITRILVQMIGFIST